MIKGLKQLFKRTKSTEIVPFSLTKYYQGEFKKNVVNAETTPKKYEGARADYPGPVEPQPNAQFGMGTKHLYKYHI